MGFLKNGWRLVESLFYEENAAMTAAKYYLYWYFVESINAEQIKIEFLDLESKVFTASYTFLTWFMSCLIGHRVEHVFSLEAYFAARRFVEGRLESESIESVLKSLDAVLKKYRVNSFVEDLAPWIKYQAASNELWSAKSKFAKWEDVVKEDVEILDCELPTIEAIASAFSKILRYQSLIEDMKIDFNMSKSAVELLANYDEYSLRTLVDSFFAMEHCSGQLLIHVVVTECTNAAWDLYSILEYAREGNIYALYDFLRMKNVKLPSIVHRYANLLPGTNYKQMQF